MENSEEGPEKDKAIQSLIGGLEDRSDVLANQLIPALYDELRALAHNKLRYERKNHTLNTTALVHEAYLKLSQQNKQEWKNYGQFLAISAQIMRRLLINHAEKRKAQKRGGGQSVIPLDSIPEVIDEDRADLLLSIDEALDRLSQFDKRGSTIVELKFFGGLTQVEIADYLGVTERTVRRSWVMAKTWIQKELNKEDILP